MLLMTQQQIVYCLLVRHFTEHKVKFTMHITLLHSDNDPSTRYWIHYGK